MRFWRRVLFFVLAEGLGAMAQSAPKVPKSGDTLAIVNGHALTRGELDDKQASSMLQLRYDYYRAEHDTLERLIDNELLEAEAQHRAIPVDRLIEQEVNEKVVDPTDEQLRTFYEGLQTDQTFEAVKAQLIVRVRQTRTKLAREAFVNSLRSKASIEILLASPHTEVSTADAPARGPKNAPVALVEFADFECPFCRQMQPEIERLVKEYDGRLTLFYKQFPLSIHPHAEKAAEASRCAGDQGAFWPYHDILFRDGSVLEVSQLKENAHLLKLDAARFDACLDSGEQAAAIQKDVAQGLRLGLAGTPGFFINGHFLSGVVSYATLRETVDQQLKPTAGTN